MSYRAVWHINRKKFIIRASFEYLDARTRSATTAGSDHLFVLCYFQRGDDEFLDLARAADV
eukprot:9290117-Pyramimonas_sp.AAC.1